MNPTTSDELEIGNKVETVADLHLLCEDLIGKGKGDTRLMFDTDAQNFDVHLVPVTYASWESAELVGEDTFILSNTEPYGKYAKREIRIRINGTFVRIPQERITYEELVKIANPGAETEGVLYTVVVAHKGIGKSLRPGETLHLLDGMFIEVVFTGNS